MTKRKFKKGIERTELGKHQEGEMLKRAFVIGAIIVILIIAIAFLVDPHFLEAEAETISTKEVQATTPIVVNKSLSIAPVYIAKTTTTPEPLPTAKQINLVVKKKKDKWKPAEDEVIAAAKMMYGEARGESDERCAATLWVAINRTMDPKGRWSKDLVKVIEQKNQFTGYSRNHPVTSRLKWLAKDVLKRHHREEQGEKKVGRTIPPNYYFFGGSTGLNRFRKGSSVDGHFWNWSLPNPYKDKRR